MSTILSTILPITQAFATSIVNLDEVPHNITLEAGGELVEVSLMPYAKWESSAYPLRVRYEDGYVTPALEPDGNYAIWPDGNVVLQRRGTLGQKH